MQALRADDSLRRLLLREPRGSVATHANLIVPATRQDCDVGYIIMEPTEYPAMSGSNTICVATVLLETGMVELREPETTLRLEAPGGVVEVTRRVPRRTGRERRADERPVLRRPARRARSRSTGSGIAHRGRRVRRHVVRDRRRGTRSASRSSRTRRASSRASAS